MGETSPRGIQATLFDYFQDTEYFSIQEANELVLEHQNRAVNTESIRARIYEGIDKGLFERVGKGLYTVTRTDEQGRENTCLLINGDGRDLSMIPSNSVDALITDHPYRLPSSLKGGNRNFADYELFQYNEHDFKEKQRVLKPGCFLVEFLPEENGDNYQYLFQVKDLARKAGLEYYAKVPWVKTGFVANTGRKSKNTEDVVFFSKGRARDLRPDAKKDKAEPGVEHFMSGAAGMLPTVFDVAPPSKKDKIHQAEKPVELLQQILRFITKEDELVLDQFAGSGVLGEAALKSHRDCILIEKDVETYNKLRERISALGEVEVISAGQREAINVAIDALEAAQEGPDQMKAFAAYQNNHGMALSEAFHTLTDIPVSSYNEALQDAFSAAGSAIEAADLQELSKVHSEPEKKILECSTRGDRRFSSLFAMVTIKGKEKSIEEWYQDAKRTADGKKAGKGKPFDYIIDPFTGDKLPGKEAQWLYRGLWITYFSKNPDLVSYAEQFDGFTNCFNKHKDPDVEVLRGPGQQNTIRLEDSVEEIICAYMKGDRKRYVDVVKASKWYKNMASKKKPPLAAQIDNAAAKRSEPAATHEKTYPVADRHM